MPIDDDKQRLLQKKIDDLEKELEIKLEHTTLHRVKLNTFQMSQLKSIFDDILHNANVPEKSTVQTAELKFRVGMTINNEYINLPAAVVDADNRIIINIKATSGIRDSLDKKLIIRKANDKISEKGPNDNIPTLTEANIKFLAPDSYPVPGYDKNHLLNTKKNQAGIPVEVIQKNDKILVKIGPCDLSGVGGHKAREKIIKDLVELALKDSGLDYTYEQINVSACVGVRGRMQMLMSPFTKNHCGSHMNGYIKTAGEQKLTHWEPRKGPQSFFNDTICAMVISTATSLFEHQVMNTEDPTYNSEKATTQILKIKEMKLLFDRFLASAHKKINDLVDKFKEYNKETKPSGPRP